MYYPSVPVSDKQLLTSFISNACVECCYDAITKRSHVLDVCKSDVILKQTVSFPSPYMLYVHACSTFSTVGTFMRVKCKCVSARVKIVEKGIFWQLYRRQCIQAFYSLGQVCASIKIRYSDTEKAWLTFHCSQPLHNYP